MNHAVAGGLLGALCGGLVGWAVASRSAGPGAAGADDLRAAAAEMREAAALWRSAAEVAARRPPTLSPAAADPLPAPSPSSRLAAEPTEVSGGSASTSPGADRLPLPAARRGDVGWLAQWDERTEVEEGPRPPTAAATEVRRRWFLASDAEVLDAFGTPDEAWGDAGGDYWKYQLPAEADGRKRVVVLTFRRGRLYDVSG